jgi:hypothetical protein
LHLIVLKQQRMKTEIKPIALNRWEKYRLTQYTVLASWAV